MPLGLTLEGLAPEGLTLERSTPEGLTLERSTLEGLTFEPLPSKSLPFILIVASHLSISAWLGARTSIIVSSMPAANMTAVGNT